MSCIAAVIRFRVHLYLSPISIAVIVLAQITNGVDWLFSGILALCQHYGFSNTDYYDWWIIILTNHISG